MESSAQEQHFTNKLISPEIITELKDALYLYHA
jgi:hypothetical protein